MLKEVSPRPDFTALEKDVLRLWDENDIFGKLRKQNDGNRRWSFIDGPITANNKMGVHHAWGRTLKDIFQRYKAMRGYDQRYQNGFDCQGLWVEVEVEKQLGFDRKQQILDYGLDKFSRACRERVMKYSAIIDEQSRRLGQWYVSDGSYFTYSDTNIENIWHFLKLCREKGWLIKGHRVMPWCARCGTSLSQHEMLDSYAETTHTAVFVRARLVGTPDTSILVWTTTPWTLSANTALSVHPDLVYAYCAVGDETVILAKSVVERVLGKTAKIVREVKGAELVGAEYEAFFPDFHHQHGFGHKVIAWSEVSADEGTGVVHTAPGCGAEDFELAGPNGLKILTPIDENGNYFDGYGFLSGKNVHHVLPEILENLTAQAKLFKTERYSHRYPFCWRCNDELVFRLVDEWFIRCDEIRPLMIAAAKQVEWKPAHILHNMLDWLENMGNWCISRKRFWGLPLPFYVCGKCSHINIVGSKKELLARAVNPDAKLPELHRPWIDNIKIACESCGAEVTRVTEVGDCWLDAGIVPFSTLKYHEDRAYWEKWFPAEFVCEMREQTRLWFYSLLFMAVTLEGKTPYKCVLAYEKVFDENGKPMHKSAGNAIWFDDAVEKMGADVMRWIYASWPVQNNLLFGYGLADDIRRKLITLWNSYSFFVTYARLDNPDLKAPAEQAALSDMDRWILAEYHALVRRTGELLDDFQTPPVMREIDRFIDCLSNGYIRANRRRFWKSGSDSDKRAAYSTLYAVLVGLARLIAPIMPFIAEEVYQNLVRNVDPDAPESVHLTAFPEADESLIDAELQERMNAANRLINAILSLRSASGLKVRQPLDEVVVASGDPTVREAVERFGAIILAEVNVKTIRLAADPSAYRTRSFKLNFKALGPKFGRDVQKIGSAVKAYSDRELAARLAEGALELEIDGRKIGLSPEDFTSEETVDPAYAATSENDFSVAIRIELSAALRREGAVRDFVRFVQALRKDSGFEVTDRVAISYSTESPELREAIGAFDEYIRGETLADSLVSVDNISCEARSAGGHDVRIAVVKTA